MRNQANLLSSPAWLSLFFSLSNDSYVGLMISTSLSIPNANCIAVSLNEVKTYKSFTSASRLTGNFPAEANPNRSGNSNDLQHMKKHIPIGFESLAEPMA